MATPREPAVTPVVGGNAGVAAPRRRRAQVGDGAAAARPARREPVRDGRRSRWSCWCSSRSSRPSTRAASRSCCPGILALAIISTSLVNLGIATAFERVYGVLKRLGGSPLPRSGLIARQDRDGGRRRDRPGRAARRRSPRRPSAGGPGRAPTRPCASPRSRSARSPSPGSACSWPGRSAPRRRWRWPTASSSVPAARAGSSCPSTTCRPLLADLARVLPAAALSDALRIGLGAASGDPLPAARASSPRGPSRRPSRVANVPLGVTREPRSVAACAPRRAASRPRAGSPRRGAP